jgi:Response regulator containing a CheY-like receiver domain and an HTH DNA-binding domain
MIIEALKAGADGYIMKDSKSDDFIEAIYTISNGQIYLSHPVSTVLVREYIQKSMFRFLILKIFNASQQEKGKFYRLFQKA